MPQKNVTGNLIWESADGATTVRIAEAVVRGISVDIMRGFGVTRRRGAEPGGLLLGRTSRNSRKLVIDVEGYRDVPCEHAHGPSYLLSDNDHGRLRDAIREVRDSGGQRGVVGLYRGHTRDGMGADESDADLWTRHLHGISGLLLLVKPFATRPATALIVLAQDGQVSLDAPADTEFAFAAHRPDTAPVPPPDHYPSLPQPPPPSAPPPHSAHATAAPAVTPLPQSRAVAPASVQDNDRVLNSVLGLRHTHQPAPAPEVMQTAEPLTDGSPPHPHNKPSTLLRTMAWLLFTAAAISLGAVAGFRMGRGDFPAARTTAPGASINNPFESIGLTARLRGQSLLVTWSHTPAAVRAATAGVLTVRTDNGEQEIPLRDFEVREGVLLVRTPSREAFIRLELRLPDDLIVAEEVHWRRDAILQP